MNRRSSLIALGSGLSTLPWLKSSLASAQFPQHNVRIVVNSNAGVSTDMMARAIAPHLQAAWGQSVVIDNKPGASGTIGAADVVRSKADGHTLLVGVTGLQQTEFLMPKLSYKFSKDLAPIVMMCKGANALAVPANSPHQTLEDWIATVRREPGKHSYGSYGTGTTAHIWGETFKRKAGIDVIHVPFKGSALMLQDLMAGQIGTALPDLAGAMPMIKAGKLRVLALSGTERHPAFPQVPTFKERGFDGLEPYGWYGVLAPNATPKPIIDAIAKAWLEAMQTPKVKTLIDDLGLLTVAAGPEAFQGILQADRPVWERAIRESNIQLDG